MSTARPERTRNRSTAFQRWHREQLPGSFEAVDIDLVLRCHHCHEPLALIEDTTSRGKRDEHMRTQIAAARRLCLPFVLVLFEADANDRLVAFQWRLAWPSQSHWRRQEQWAAWEAFIRDGHSCQRPAA